MVRIAILSDIHFGKFSRTKELAVPGEAIQDETSGAAPLVDGMVQILKEMKVEYIFIAGDLTSVASPQEFYYCEKKLLEIAEKVGVVSEKIICCLGNHDIDRNITKLSDDVLGKEVDEEVARIVREKYNLIAAGCANSNLEKLIPIQGKLGPIPCSGVYEENRFVVFILNSGWQCTHDQAYPHGKLTERQLKWLDEESTRYKNDERIKIVLVHHHPFKYTYPIPAPDISEMEEGSEFMVIVNKNEIQIVIHGHRHHPIVKTIQYGSGKIPISLICAGSFSVNSAHRGEEIPNTMHILELSSKEQGSILYNYKYTASQGWQKLKFCKATPLDYKMKLGKLFSRDEIKEEVIKLQEQSSKAIAWENLNEKLQYISSDELNNALRIELSKKYRIVGAFPDEVVLLTK